MATSKYISPYSQEQISRYTDMFFDGKDHSNDAAYNAFMNDTEFQNALASGIQGQVFDIGLTAADTLAPVDYTNPGASGALNWIDMEPARASNETNYWQTNAAPVINAPADVLAQAKANPGVPINLTEGGQGYVWTDGELHQTNFVNNTGSPTSVVLPLVLSMMAPGIGTALGTSLGLTGTTAAIVGGAALGGGTAALTGADIEQGILGGAIGGAGSGLSSSISNALGTSGTLGSVLGGAGAGALTSLASGGDVTQGLVTGGLSGLARGLLTPSDITVSPFEQQLPSEFDQYLAADSGVTVPFEAATLPSSFDQYLAPISNVTVPTQIEQTQSLNDFIESISQYEVPITQAPIDISSLPQFVDQYADIPEMVITAPSVQTVPTFEQQQPSLNDFIESISQYEVPVSTIDYSLGGIGAPRLDSMNGAQGIQVPVINEPVTVADVPIDYSLNTSVPFEGLQMPALPNLDSMGGGQGLSVAVPGGTVAEGGFVPTGTLPNLGDPTSFINNPNAIEEAIAATPATTGLTQSQVVNLIRGALGTLVASNATQPEEQSGFSIIPIPAEWRSPEYNTAFAPSAPIDFGSSALLKGTQWQNPLAPRTNKSISDVINAINYQPNQSRYLPPTVRVNDIIGGLNGKQVSISDIISGIQGQYGQKAAS